MSEMVYDIVVKQYINSLHALKTVLGKAKVHAETQKFKPEMYLDMKLAPDMFNFVRQVQVVSDNAKGAVCRLVGKEIPSYPDTEKTFEELLARLDKTINFVTTFKAQDFKDFAKQKVSFAYYPGNHLSGYDFLVHYSIPNFYFHLTTCYAILRSAGVPIGKTDFMGEVPWKKA